MQPNWHALLEKSITGLDGLPDHLIGSPALFDRAGAQAAAAVYPMRINAYYAGLIRHPADALAGQVLPDIREIREYSEPAGAFPELEDDPLAEKKQSPVPGIIHRYPDRVVFLVSSRCPVLCRFCMRKRLAGRSAPLTTAGMDTALAYISSHDTIREVILSGGDPLLLEDDALESLLKALRKMPHLDLIRIHSRTPCALPQRITPSLLAILRRYHPLYLNIHINHPDEITAIMAEACAGLADAGLPLGSQTVLLKGINDNPVVMETLFRRLLRMRIKPYYLHHPDLVRGTGHFRVPVQTGLNIMSALQGRLSGTAIPRYMIDLPGGGGKVPLLPDYIQGRDGDRLIVGNYQGKRYCYPADA